MIKTKQEETKTSNGSYLICLPLTASPNLKIKKDASISEKYTYQIIPY